MKYFTVLFPSKAKGDDVVTFKAEDFDDALRKVGEDYPNVTYRLYAGKGVPQKKAEDKKIPPTKR